MTLGDLNWRCSLTLVLQSIDPLFLPLHQHRVRGSQEGGQRCPYRSSHDVVTPVPTVFRSRYWDSLSAITHEFNIQFHHTRRSKTRREQVEDLPTYDTVADMSSPSTVVMVFPPCFVNPRARSDGLLEDFVITRLRPPESVFFTYVLRIWYLRCI